MFPLVVTLLSLLLKIPPSRSHVLPIPYPRTLTSLRPGSILEGSSLLR
jgi:hypothetical protein